MPFLLFNRARSPTTQAWTKEIRPLAQRSKTDNTVSETTLGNRLEPVATVTRPGLRKRNTESLTALFARFSAMAVVARGREEKGDGDGVGVNVGAGGEWEDRKLKGREKREERRRVKLLLQGWSFESAGNRNKNSTPRKAGERQRDVDANADADDDEQVDIYGKEYTAEQAQEEDVSPRGSVAGRGRAARA